MKLATVSILLLILFTNFVKQQPEKDKFDRNIFYTALASDNPELIDRQVNIIATSKLKEKPAFEGTLLMKKAGLVKSAKEKLSLFKKGRLVLEEAIAADPTNAEYRFLRLMIQENAPDILKYNKDITTDSTHIDNHFHSLPPEAKIAVVEYSKKSKVLNKKNFHN